MAYWQNSISLFSRALDVTRNNPVARNNLALALVDAGRIEAAVAHFRILVRDLPDSYKAHTNLGVALARAEQFEDAVYHYREALRIRRPGAVYKRLRTPVVYIVRIIHHLTDDLRICQTLAQPIKFQITIPKSQININDRKLKPEWPEKPNNGFEITSNVFWSLDFEILNLCVIWCFLNLYK